MRLCPAWILVLLVAAAWVPAQTTPVTVATHYFYWYAWPDQHFNADGRPGREGHCRQFPEPEQVDYRSVAWHRANFAAMAACGIDVALPVYWGAPGAYDKPDLAFARAGLPPMVEALAQLAAARLPAPKLGLFYDTSTLANDVRGAAPRHGKPDLTTAAGRELFCTTVLEYFAALPKACWARHRGGVLVVLYVSGFAARWDARLGPALRRAFAERFDGDEVCLVADASWGDIGQDLTTSWGAALWGPSLFQDVAQLGPGYDDRAVPGRCTPVREREDGSFYAWSWQRVLRHRPELVLLETWNEMHEGTELCPTRELGSQYVDATRAWIDRLRRRADPGPPVRLRFPEPRSMPDLSWGAEGKDQDEVRVDYRGAAVERRGLRELAWEDGPCAVGDGALRAGRVAAELGSYLYFQVSDHFAFDTDLDLDLVVVRAADTPVAVEYDAAQARAPLAGSYTPGRLVGEQRAGAVVTCTFRLPHARLANRQNGGADLRLCLPQRAGTVLSLVLRKHR